MNRLLPAILLIMNWLMVESVCSQQYGFQVFSLEQGLPQSEVQALLQDSRGSIWVGTNGGGVSRFNGNSFESFTVEDGLPHNRINTLFEDSRGQLWMGAINGIGRYDGISFSSYSENIGPQQVNYIQFFEFDDGGIGVISQDEQNAFRILRISGDSILPVHDQYEEFSCNPVYRAIYLSDSILYLTTSDGLYEMKNGEVSFSTLNDHREFMGRAILPVLYDDKGILWILSFASRYDVLIYTLDNGKITRFNSPDTDWWRGVGSVFKDSRGRIWFNNFGRGVSFIDTESGSIHYFMQENGLSNEYINAFLEDHEGNIWLGSSGGGLIKYAKKNFLAYNFQSIINDDMVRSIYQDSHDNYWFGLASGGVVRFDGTRYTAYTTEQYPGIHNVRSFIELGENKLMLLSFNGLYLFNGKTMKQVDTDYSLQNFFFSDAVQDEDTLWISSFNGGVIKIVNKEIEFYNLGNGRLHSNIVNDIYKDTGKNIWFCTNNGIAVYREGRLSVYTAKEGLTSSTVMHMVEDKLGRYWFASYTGGLYILEDEEFSCLTTADGLSSNNIYSILCDQQGNIWAGSQSGVDRLVLDEGGNITEVEHFGIYDGFTGIECNGQSNLIDREGHLWFGTVKGAMRYDPASRIKNEVPPITHITGLRLFFETVDWSGPEYNDVTEGIIPWYRLPKEPVFPHHLNHLSFDFEALSFQVHEKVAYQWKLEGLDKDWSPVGRRTEAVYPNIPPGSYTFKVKAMNNDGLWNSQPTEYSFTVKSPWWKSWWFYSLSALLILAALGIIVRFRINLIEAKQRELEEIVTAKTYEVTTQRDEIAKQNLLLEQQKEEILSQSEKLQLAYNDLEYLSEIGKIITSQLSVENIIDTVYDSINKLMDASVFGIGLVNRKKQSIDFPGVKEKGQKLDFLSFSMNDVDRLSVYCIREKAEVFINDFEKEYKKYLPVMTPAGSDGNSSSIIYLPLLMDSEVMGVITVQSFEKDAYTDYHLNILRNLAVYTKIALENASSYQQIEAQSINLKKANSDIIKQKEEIEKANAELIELNKEKNHLIGIVAHDLRNPLTSSLSVADNLLISAQKTDKDEKEGLSFIVNALKRMDKMISKILDISMIEQNQVNMKCEKINFGLIVQDVYSSLKDTADRKGIGIQLETLDIYGIADRNYLLQVYENLLSNAIKFSPADTIILIKCEELKHETRVNFIDEGPGISEEDRKRIFNKYQRLSARPTAGEQSTGLGLSIVRKYVDLMGGRVWYESAGSKGSNFIVSFDKTDN